MYRILVGGYRDENKKTLKPPPRYLHVSHKSLTFTTDQYLPSLNFNGVCSHAPENGWIRAIVSSTRWAPTTNHRYKLMEL